MTIDDFIEELARVPVLWRHDTDGNLELAIRVVDNSGWCGACPIVALAWHHSHTGFARLEFVPAGAALGLSRSDSQLIAVAADNDYASQRFGFDAALRRRIERACGLATESL